MILRKPRRAGVFYELVENVINPGLFRSIQLLLVYLYTFWFHSLDARLQRFPVPIGRGGVCSRRLLV